MTESTVTDSNELVSREDTEALLLSRPIARLRQQQAHGAVNPIVLAEAVGVRAQMIYTYIRTGKIAAYLTEDTQKLMIRWDDAITFAQAYLNKKAIQQAKIEQQLKGES